MCDSGTKMIMIAALIDTVGVVSRTAHGKTGQQRTHAIAAKTPSPKTKTRIVNVRLKPGLEATARLRSGD